MSFTNSKAFKKYFVPGIVFQSVVIAGGYGTGRELVEFFLNYGALGGLIAMCTVSVLTWSIMSAVSFEFARVFKTYNYRPFFKKLLGKYWFLYEICYFVILILILSVCAATAGSVLQELFGWSYWVGVIGLMLGTGLLVFKGSGTIEKVLSVWSFVLYAVYILLLIFAFTKFGGVIGKTLANGEIKPGFILSGFKYAWYTLGTIPVILFTVRHIETRKEAICSGLIAGVIGILPAIFLYLALLSQYPDVLTATVPINNLLNGIGSPVFQAIFQIALFGTIIETATGFIHGINERILTVYKERGKEMPKSVTVLVTVALLITGVFVSQFGLINLIAKGYGTATWGFFFVFAIPMLTIGIWKIKNSKQIIGSNQEVD